MTQQPGTVFTRLGIDRAEVRWEDSLYALTPVEERGGMLFKREDYFAPLGYGAINGAKLRQCVWLVHEYVRTGLKPCGIVSGASVKSPQLSMGTAVAKHYGLDSLLVIGATTREAAMRHENVAIATGLGARFVISPVAYNPVLQAKVAELKREMPERFQLEYGITTGGGDAHVEAFHRLGSEQVANLPATVEHLYLPAGSCNTAVSVLYGLARFRPAGLKAVTLFGIGPLRLDWIEERLAAIERASGTQVRSWFRREYKHHPALAQKHEPRGGDTAYLLRHYDLHGTKYASYQDEVPWRRQDIEFHPTYEGKVMAYLSDNAAEFPEQRAADGKVMFWIIGSRPSMARMYPPLRHVFGPKLPTTLRMWGEA